ncbi:RNA polymerase sigma factor [Sorangium sp. So ce381]|uniref:RNA polymerase sigma factor n=1 Tax=Sorangium sp. So ce381 TaxID=3133307 RepID=UPI003F5C1D94
MGSWQRFLDVFEPHRPELYRCCRYLTRSPWDAEDLVQDTMARGSDPRTGSFVGSLSPITTTDAGGVDAHHLVGYLGGPPRCEVREHGGELLLLFWFDHDTGAAVRTVWTIETDGDHIARIRNYFFTPDVIAEICRELDVPFRTNGYRYWIHG